MQELTAATNWASVTAGGSHSCAVKTTGALFCWGDDGSGQLGNGAPGTQQSPMQESTAATNWASVAAGFDFTCAVKTTGTLWCWGADGSGQLGNGASGMQQSPMQELTAATNWASVEVGDYSTCARKTTGALFCWGSNNSGEVGNNVIGGVQQTPVQESTTATNWASVTAGVSFACARKTNGTLWCWGSDAGGKLGNGQTTVSNLLRPAQESTLATNWAFLSTGHAYGCAIKPDGTLWCWGADGNGQLGNGAATTTQDTPVQELTAATNWASVSAGNTHTCAIKTTGTLLVLGQRWQWRGGQWCAHR